VGSSRRARLVSIVAVAGLATTLFAAGGGPAGAGGTNRGNVNGSLELGQLASQTGPLSNIVQSLTVPVTMAVDEINAGGGVLGKPVTYTLADDATDPNVASESLEGLLEDSKVDAIMGPTSSGITLNIIDEVRRRNVLMCSGSNTSAELSTTDSRGFYFRTTPSDRLQGPALGKLVLKDGHKKVGILARRDTYGVGGRESEVRRPDQDEEGLRREHQGQGTVHDVRRLQAPPRRGEVHQLPGRISRVQAHEQVRDVRAERRRVRGVDVRRDRPGRDRAARDSDSHRLAPERGGDGLPRLAVTPVVVGAFGRDDHEADAAGRDRRLDGGNDLARLPGP